MKISTLSLLITITLLTTTVGHSAPADYFHEATVAISKANRLEKAGKISEAQHALNEATTALRKLKGEDAHWFPDWVSAKESDINTIADRLKSATDSPSVAEVNYSLKPDEWRDVTIERAYKAHAEGRAEIPPHARGPVATAPVVQRQVKPKRIPVTKQVTPSLQKSITLERPTPSQQPQIQKPKNIVQPIPQTNTSSVQEIKPIPMVPKVENPQPIPKPKKQRRTHRFRIGD